MSEPRNCAEYEMKTSTPLACRSTRE